MTEVKQAKELKNASYEIFILLLSLLSLFNLAMLLIPGVDPVIKEVVAAIDVLITTIFILDFLYRFLTAESKSAYFFKNYGWADLLASLPVQQLKIFRIFRVVRVFRLSNYWMAYHVARAALQSRRQCLISDHIPRLAAAGIWGYCDCIHRS